MIFQVDTMNKAPFFRTPPVTPALRRQIFYLMSPFLCISRVVICLVLLLFNLKGRKKRGAQRATVLSCCFSFLCLILMSWSLEHEYLKPLSTERGWGWVVRAYGCCFLVFVLQHNHSLDCGMEACVKDMVVCYL